MSWHGVLLAETARAAPENMRGGVTDSVQSFCQLDALALPLAYSSQPDLIGSHGAGFFVCRVAARWVGVQLLRQRDPTKR